MLKLKMVVRYQYPTLVQFRRLRCSQLRVLRWSPVDHTDPVCMAIKSTIMTVSSFEMHAWCVVKKAFLKVSTLHVAEIKTSSSTLQTLFNYYLSPSDDDQEELDSDDEEYYGNHNVDTSRVDEIPAKEPKFNAVSRKPC